MAESMSEIKEQGKTPEEKLSEVETGNLLENEFRVMIAKVILSLEKKRGKEQKEARNV